MITSKRRAPPCSPGGMFTDTRRMDNEAYFLSRRDDHIMVLKMRFFGGVCDMVLSMMSSRTTNRKGDVE